MDDDFSVIDLDQKTICKNCGCPNDSFNTTCEECGAELSASVEENENDKHSRKKQKKHKKIKVIILLLSALLVIAAAFISVFHVIPLIKSKKAFESALTYEENLDYEQALYYYELVIPNDVDNYTIATEKAEKLKKIFRLPNFAQKLLLLPEIKKSSLH